MTKAGFAVAHRLSTRMFVLHPHVVFHYQPASIILILLLPVLISGVTGVKPTFHTQGFAEDLFLQPGYCNIIAEDVCISASVAPANRMIFATSFCLSSGIRYFTSFLCSSLAPAFQAETVGSLRGPKE